MNRLLNYHYCFLVDISVNFIVAVYLYIFDPKLQYIWETRDGLIIKSIAVLEYPGYTNHLLLGVITIASNGYIIIKVITFLVKEYGYYDNIAIILIELILAIILLILLCYLIYNPIVIALLVCIGVGFSIVSLAS